VSDYSNYSINGSSVNSLNYTDDDAADIAALLDRKGYDIFIRIDDGSQSYGEYDSSDIKKATKEQFKDDIEYIRTTASDNALVLIYFSSHGTSMYGTTNNEDPTSETEYNEWLIPFVDSPTDISSISDIETYWISDDDMASKIRSLNNNKTVLTIDACFSGGFIGSSYDISAVPEDYSETNNSIDGVFGKAFRSYFDDSDADVTWKDAIVITASGEKEESLEPGGGSSTVENGFFTLGLLNAISNDENNDGYITTLEWYSGSKAFIENNINSSEFISEARQYLPRISGGPVDYVLFEAD